MLLLLLDLAQVLIFTLFYHILEKSSNWVLGYEALLDRMVEKNYTFLGLTTNKELLRSHGYLTYSYDSIYAFALAVKQVCFPNLFKYFLFYIY